MFDRVRKILSRVFPARIVVRRVKRMSAEELTMAFSVMDDDRLLQAVHCLLEDAISGANNIAQAPASAMSHGQIAYYSGGAAHLEMFREALLSMHAQARGRKEEE